MNWYTAEDKAKSVREVVLEVPSRTRSSPSSDADARTKYHMLRANVGLRVSSAWKVTRDRTSCSRRRPCRQAQESTVPCRVLLLPDEGGRLGRCLCRLSTAQDRGVPSAPYVLLR